MTTVPETVPMRGLHAASVAEEEQRIDSLIRQFINQPRESETDKPLGTA
jgi:hypothetical protein